jgi:hypothetical protein
MKKLIFFKNSNTFLIKGHKVIFFILNFFNYSLFKLHGLIKYDRNIGNQSTFWSPYDKSIFLSICFVLFTPAVAFTFFYDRNIMFDEIGLYNAIYTYLTTGHMTYPAHGWPDAMFVHPPFHYWITANFMKLGFELIDASALPSLIIFLMVILVLYHGLFSLIDAILWTLVYFLSVYIFSYFYTVRPDIHILSALLLTVLLGQASVQSKKNQRFYILFCALSAGYTFCLHYWAFPVVFVPLIFYVASNENRSFLFNSQLIKIILAMLVFILPYLIISVIPNFLNIYEMISYKTSNGFHDSWERHSISVKIFFNKYDSHRLMIKYLLYPSYWLNLFPFFFIFILLFFRNLRALAIASMLVPFFVLMKASSKEIGYIGYFGPEYAFYFFTIFKLSISGLTLFYDKIMMRIKFVRFYLSHLFLTKIILIFFVIFALLTPPISMPPKYAWRVSMDYLDLMRMGSLLVLGPDKNIATVSAGNWYTLGVKNVDFATFNNLISIRNKNGDVINYLKKFDSVSYQVGNYWNNHRDYVPLMLWYTERKIFLSNFNIFLPEPSSSQLFFKTTPRNTPLEGIFIGKNFSFLFNENSDGKYKFEVYLCDKRLSNDLIQSFSASVDFFYTMPIADNPGDSVPYYILASSGIYELEKITRRIPNYCKLFESILGERTYLDLEDLKRKTKSINPLTTFKKEN